MKSSKLGFGLLSVVVFIFFVVVDVFCFAQLVLGSCVGPFVY